MTWKKIWSYLPVHYNTVIGTIENLTQKTIIKTNLSGNRIRIKFSNLYGEKPLIIETAAISKGELNKNQLKKSVPITCQGKKKIVLEPFQEFYSDEIGFDVEAGEWIALYIYVKEKTEITSACSNWSVNSCKTVYGINGDFSGSEEFEPKESYEIYPYVNDDVNKANIVIGVCEVCVYTEERVKTIALFGDSITHMSYYHDALLERLEKEAKGKTTIINCGIGGNRLLRNATYMPDMPGEGICFGKAGVLRFEEDVCKQNDVDAVIILEGINDILHPFQFNYPKEKVSTQDLISGTKKLIQIAHNYGIKVYIGTIMPFFAEDTRGIKEGEEIRKNFNEWIRSQEDVDGIVDFSNAVENKSNREYMEESCHIGDGLHPGSEGGRRMAEAIPSKWFV